MYEEQVIPLVEHGKDNFSSLHARIFRNVVSDQDKVRLLDEMGNGKYTICRYSVAVKIRSYAERHVLLAQTGNSIRYEIHTAMVFDAKMTDRLTGKTLSKTYTADGKTRPMMATFGPRYRSTAGALNRRRIFGFYGQKLTQMVQKDLIGFISK